MRQTWDRIRLIGRPRVYFGDLNGVLPHALFRVFAGLTRRIAVICCCAGRIFRIFAKKKLGAVDSGRRVATRRASRFLRGGGCCPRDGANEMAKPTTIKIRLNSTADTGHFYVTKKNARTMTEKMVVKKYDPVVRKHVEYKEGKIK